MKKLLRNSILIIFATTLLWMVANAAPFIEMVQHSGMAEVFQMEPDSLESTPPANLKYKIKDETGVPLLDEQTETGLDLADPENLDYRTEYDYQTGNVTVYRKVGDMDVRLPYTMSLDEFRNQDSRRSVMSYWRQKQQESAPYSEKEFSILNPTWHVGGDLFEGIFGSDEINIKLQGMAELRVGVQHTKIDNPTLQEKLRSTTTFDFQEKIQMNVNGTIGERLKLGVNYNTEATFDFENQVNLEYEGGEDDILKKVEAGNITMPLPGTLITGSQSLFGVKTEMQFGKLSVTSVFSQQRGETKVLNVEGGAETQEFEIRADQYDKNRNFFLSHYFKERYDQSLSQLPLVLSTYNITRVEVWVTNTRSDNTQSRNVVAFMDLGENLQNTDNTLWGGKNGSVPSNDANTLYFNMTEGAYKEVRDINKVTSTLNPLYGQGFRNAEDYEKLENARKLTESEYTINTALGYISLNSALNSDEVLAIAYEYTESGQTYRVGEFSNDQTNDSEKALILKLIKGTNLSPNINTWGLMMKNIYSINAYQVNREDFVLDVTYANDSTGSDINYLSEGPQTNMAGEKVNGQLFIRLMNLDNLNDRNDYQTDGDGIFDFIDNTTIRTSNGRIIFPVLEPFGKNMAAKFDGNKDLIKKYEFRTLYDSTQVKAEEDASHNKYKLKGKFKSKSGSEISLNAMNIPDGSVIVTAGGIRLVENVDYTVDYTLGRVRIINQGYLNSGTPIQVSLENQSLFNLQTKTLTGAHLNYEFNKNFNLGGTIMHLNERPLTQKVNIGDEPISNTIWGLNTSYFKESNAITQAIDWLPILQTKEASSITFEGEFAQIIPGHPSVIDETGTSYLDDFEGTSISYDMRNWQAWQLASTPQGQSIFKEGDLIDNRLGGVNRARLAWYSIDPLFLRNDTRTPSHLKNNEDEKKNHFVREVFESELFPNRQTAYGEPTNISVLNLAFYPQERGPYNFDAGDNGVLNEGIKLSAGIDDNGALKDPTSRWGGMMRKIDVNDFEAANIEYIEFWMMDPYVYDTNGQDNTGSIYFNLGNVSEDILRDSRKSFEQGLPGPGEPQDVATTDWGYVSIKQNLVNGFSTDDNARLAQDVGLDGMNSDTERDFYNKGSYPFITKIDEMSSLSQAAKDLIKNDPSSDDFRYFRGSDFDSQQAGILERYRRFNNPEGNSKPSQYSGESYSTASTSLPDGEDINLDNTLSENESYYQYKVDLSKSTMSVGDNPYIVDSRKGTIPDNNGVMANWYLFRIPIQSPTSRVGTISDLRSVRFMRLFMRGFSETTVVRLATLDLVKGDWRKFKESLNEVTDKVTPNPTTVFEVSAVNIEENGQKSPVNYILPPGIDRVVDPANPQLRKLNEQSLLLKVKDLAGGDARAVYKTTNMDMRQYKRLKMFVHAEAIEGKDLLDNEMVAFIRLGSDYVDNYYEYEIPLKLTPEGNYSDDSEQDRYIVWPSQNEFDIPLDLFQTIKLKRNDDKRSDPSISMSSVKTYPDPDKPNNYAKVKGNPNLSNVRTITMGVRTRGSRQKSVEVWMNELRLTDFDEKGGWAANARVTVKLADLGNISVAGKMSTVGFGGIEQSVQERSQEEFQQYDIATNLELGKFTGAESPLSIPMYLGLSESVSTPKYYPLDPDIPLDIALDNASSQADRDRINELSQSVVTRKSINFTNVRLVPKSDKVAFYSPTNLAATYSYNSTNRRDVKIDHNSDENHRAILGYSYNVRTKPVEPFKGIESKNLALIKDFNFYYLPSQVSYRWEFDRQYQEMQLRNTAGTAYKPSLSVSKSFDWNRYFDMRYNITKALKLNFRAVTNARIDEPEGAVDKNADKDKYYEWRDEVVSNIMSFGRITTYQHSFDVSYAIPINKVPLLDWTSANATYRAMYQWDAKPEARSGQADVPDFGNTIRNSNTVMGNGQLNFATLYKKVPYFKALDTKYGSSKPNNAGATQTARFNDTNINFVAGKPYVVNHKLKSKDVSVRAFDNKGKPVKGAITVINTNKLEFVPEESAEGGRIMATGTVEDDNSPLTLVLDYSSLILTSVKNLTISYSQNTGTILPGYNQGADAMGTTNSFSAPGVPFILGIQDRNFAIDAANNGWLTTDPNMVNPYLMTYKEDLSLKTTLEPIKGLRIDLTADRSFSRNLSEYYTGGSNTPTSQSERGAFSMSYNMWRTMFTNVERTGALSSPTYAQFLANRQVVADRLLVEEGVVYDVNSQEVLIPSLLSAYSGTSPNAVFTDDFPSWTEMTPNWRVTYDELAKIQAFKSLMKTFSITHAYRSSYNMGAYVTRVLPNNQADFVYDIAAITVADQFAPLVGLNVNWINNFTTRLDYKKSRTINMSMGNNQLIENYNNEWVVGFGYRFDKMNLIFGKGGKQKSLSNDLNLRFDFSWRDDISIIRKIQEGYNQLTSGRNVITWKFTADYALSDRFNMQLFYDTNINTPYISLAYPVTTSNVGVSFRFSLAQ